MITGSHPLGIPRVVHRIWLGSEPLPEVFHRYGETWRHHHPDWDMRLWTEADLRAFDLGHALSKARSNVERSNLLRIQVVLQFGGIYADTDIECLRSLEPLIRSATAFAVWGDRDPERRPRLNNFLFGAVPGHPAIRNALDRTANVIGTGTPPANTLGAFTQALLWHSDVVKLDTMKPFAPIDRRRSKAYAIHHATRLWDQEPKDTEQKIEYLRRRLSKVQEQAKRQMRVAAEAELRARKAEREATKAKRRLAKREAEIDVIRGSVWWRLQPRFSFGRRSGDADA